MERAGGKQVGTREGDNMLDTRVGDNMVGTRRDGMLYTRGDNMVG